MRKRTVATTPTHLDRGGERTFVSLWKHEPMLGAIELHSARRADLEVEDGLLEEHFLRRGRPNCRWQ